MYVAVKTKCLRCFSFGLSCLVLLSSLSCSSLGSSKGDQETLMVSVEAFNNAIRWEEYKMASAMIAPSLKTSFWELVDRLQSRTRIIEYQIRDVHVGLDKLSGTAIVRYRFYDAYSPTVKYKTFNQTWVFKEKEKGWQVSKHGLEQLLPD